MSIQLVPICWTWNAFAKDYEKQFSQKKEHQNIPGTCLSSILVVEPFKTGSFPIKTRVIWVPGTQNAHSSKCFFLETSCYIEPPKKTAKGKTVGICQVTYVFKLQSKPPEINSSRSTPRDIQENTGINGDFCWYDFRVQSYPKGQLGVPLTVYPWYLLCFFRDSWWL